MNTQTKETLRTFIAIELPDPVRNAIKTVQTDLKAFGFDIRWVRPENIHLTLKFLGDVRADDIDNITTMMDRAAGTQIPFSLKARGIGVFPNMKRPRVIWVGLSGEIKLLSTFQQQLENNFEMIGLPREDRSFRGHLTLGRIKRPVDRKMFTQALSSLEAFETEPFIANEVVLYRSELKPSGAVYSKLKVIPFKAA